MLSLPMDIITLGWIAVPTFFVLSIALVVWGRNGM
ncbi:MAG: cytochrome b6-f complex subunit PetN [Cyanobacteriota bacterium]